MLLKTKNLVNYTENMKYNFCAEYLIFILKKNIAYLLFFFE